jgi:hypothetical protein
MHTQHGNPRRWERDFQAGSEMDLPRSTPAAILTYCRAAVDATRKRFRADNLLTGESVRIMPGESDVRGMPSPAGELSIRMTALV